MFNLKKHLLSIVAIVALVIIIIGGWYILSHRQIKTSEVERSISHDVSLLATTTPTQDETVNWETYRSDIYGFEIQYPPSYKIDKSFPEHVWISAQDAFSSSLPAVSVKVLSENIDAVIQQFKKNISNSEQLINEEDVVINNQSAKKLILVTDLGANQLYYFIYRDGKTFVLSCLAGEQTQVKILLTFRFIATQR